MKGIYIEETPRRGRETDFSDRHEQEEVRVRPRQQVCGERGEDGVRRVGRRKRQAATEKIETAIYNGANANAADDRGMSALHWAAEYDRPPPRHLLVNAHRFPPNPDTDINVRVGGSGRTALMLAVQRGHHECVEVLLEHEADIKLEHDEMSAVDIAIEEEDEEIYVLLCKFDPDLAEFTDDTLETHKEMMAEIDELEHEYGGLDEKHSFDDDSGVPVDRSSAMDTVASKRTGGRRQ